MQKLFRDRLPKGVLAPELDYTLCVSILSNKLSVSDGAGPFEKAMSNCTLVIIEYNRGASFPLELLPARCFCKS